MGASLEMMTISGYTDEEFSTSAGDPYTMMMNPESMKWQRVNEYNEEQAQDTSSPSQTYKGTPADILSFEIVIDCTGIVSATRTTMSTEISALRKIAFTYNGTIHRPNYLVVQWGQSIRFKCVLTTFDISYTLFQPDGSPLRAKVSMTFKKYVSTQTLAEEDGLTSPDMTHLVTVDEGMMLPQLCRKIWNRDLCYVQVAGYNKLNKFRNLKGVKKLIFPPIIPVK